MTIENVWSQCHIYQLSLHELLYKCCILVQYLLLLAVHKHESLVFTQVSLDGDGCLAPTVNQGQEETVELSCSPVVLDCHGGFMPTVIKVLLAKELESFFRVH